jgi:hypothetical protein
MPVCSSFGQYTNIRIDDYDDPNEPSIMMDPKNPNILVAGANLNNYYISKDGGKTWKNDILTSTYGIWGDPCIVVDTNGFFYYFHLSNPPAGTGSWVDRIVCQKLADIDGKWSTGTYTGKNGTKVQDKEWAYINRNNNTIYVTWTQFDKYANQNPGPEDSTIILFSKSTDGSNSWTTPVRISQYAGDCLDGDNTTEGAVPCSGPNNEIYVSWSNGEMIYFDRSTDEGETWLDKDIQACAQIGSWDINIEGIYRANGMPVTCCDLSNGPDRGTIYINFCDNRNGLNDTDVWLIKSTDGGFTWNDPKRVNDDESGSQQFLTWMTVDQATGYIYIVFYDRRNYNDTRTDVYLAYSIDGGETFTNINISNSPFIPSPFVFFGDYTNITAHNGKVIPIWTRIDNSATSIWCALINDITTSTKKEINKKKENQIINKCYFSNNGHSLEIELNIPFDNKYDIAVYNNLGAVAETLINDKYLIKGKHTLHYKTKEFKNGIYFIVLKDKNKTEAKKIIHFD